MRDKFWKICLPNLAWHGIIHAKSNGNTCFIMIIFNILSVFFILLLISISDFYTFRIPDVFLSYMLMFQIISDIQIWDSFDIAYRFVSSLLVFLLFFGVWKLYGKMGFGDVKLAVVLSYVFGFVFFFSAFLVAALLCLIVNVVWKHMALFSKKRFPLAPYMSAGCLINIMISRMLI